MKVAIVAASPRREGNSTTLARSAADGAREAGHEVAIHHLDDFVEGMLRDCRRCRLPDGSCGITDRYEELLLQQVVPADALIFATPLWWYGMSGRLKTFFDRIFCYIAGSSPHAEVVNAGLQNKKVGLLVACEESYRGATIPLIGHFQELSRYLRQDLVGVVVGVGNSRGEVELDPSGPVAAAHDLGRRLFAIRTTDYRLDTPRPNSVWRNRVEAGVGADWSADY